MSEQPLVAGETLIDFVPDADGPLAEAETFHRRAGGAPANVAVALARLDRTPLFWTRIATDAFGDFLAERLAAEGLPEDYIERDDGAATTLAFVGRGVEDPRFSFYREGTADTRMHQDTVSEETLQSIPWVHAGGVTLSSEPARSATVDLLKRAAVADCTVSFDPNVRPELWSNDAELETVCGWAIEHVDVLLATPPELRTLGYEGDDRETVARDALAAKDAPGPHTVVCTMGEDGAMAVAADHAPWPTEASHAGFDVDTVDDTGAGDAFTAGLIDALIGADDLGEAIAFGNAVAALSTTDQGAMSALPDRAAVRALLERS